jgi:hypothetical protein
MRTTEPTAKAPSTATGHSATLRALLRAKGSGAPALRHLRLTLAVTSASLLAAASLSATPAAAAEPCPNESIRALQVYAPPLPDCRAYEQASLNKNEVDAAGEVNAVQAAPSPSPLGEAGVVFFSLTPFAGAEGSKAGDQLQLSLRSAGAWATGSLMPPNYSRRNETFIRGWTRDLARTIVVSGEPVLAAGALAGPFVSNAYVRDNATNTYQLLAPDVPQNGPVRLVDASRDDSRILFESTSPLATTNVPPAGEANLYEWNEARPVGERVSLAGVLPGNVAPEAGSVGGPPHSENSGSEPVYTQNTISADGSRLFFTDSGTGVLYLREPEAERTFQLSAASAVWQASTPDGNYAFYTEAAELYRFNVRRFTESEEPEPAALAEAREQLTSGAEGLAGVLGVSNDGAYAYLVAPGVLAANKREHENANHELLVEEAEPGRNNLYQWHEGSLVFIAQDNQSHDWRPSFDWSRNEGPAGGERSSRLTPDGGTLMFSDAEAAGFDLYRAGLPVSARNPVCVTCDAGAAATSPAELTVPDRSLVARPSTDNYNAFLTHNLSDDGGRLFFETDEALLPEDVNGRRDVYEWEREGEGSCTAAAATFSPRSGGCLYLISTGQSPIESYFGDASANGDDVFFFTTQQLLASDRDGNVDVYDARVGGGILSQSLPPSPPCLEADACRAPAGAPPVFAAPSSASLSGSGNLPALRCRRGSRLRHGRCVKPKPHRKHNRHRAGYQRRGRR